MENLEKVCTVKVNTTNVVTSVKAKDSEGNPIKRRLFTSKETGLWRSDSPMQFFTGDNEGGITPISERQAMIYVKRVLKQRGEATSSFHALNFLTKNVDIMNVEEMCN